MFSILLFRYILLFAVYLPTIGTKILVPYLPYEIAISNSIPFAFHNFYFKYIMYVYFRFYLETNKGHISVLNWN